MPKLNRFANLFPAKPIIGMVHLKALPGSPDYGGNLRDVLDSALRDADSLQQGGVDGIMIENFFDAPFFKDQGVPEPVAQILIGSEIPHDSIDRFLPAVDGVLAGPSFKLGGKVESPGDLSRVQGLLSAKKAAASPK